MNIKPTAAPAIWPYPHRTLEQVQHDERRMAYIQNLHDKNRDRLRTRRCVA